MQCKLEKLGKGVGASTFFIGVAFGYHRLPAKPGMPVPLVRSLVICVKSKYTVIYQLEKAKGH